MKSFQKRNFNIMVDAIEQGISSFEQNGSGQKSECDEEPTSRKAEPSSNHQTIIRYISVIVFFKINRK